MQYLDITEVFGWLIKHLVSSRPNYVVKTIKTAWILFNSVSISFENAYISFVMKARHASFYSLNINRAFRAMIFQYPYHFGRTFSVIFIRFTLWVTNICAEVNFPAILSKTIK